MGEPGRIRGGQRLRATARCHQRSSPPGEDLARRGGDGVRRFYFAATDATETESLADLGRALASWTGGGRYAFGDWGEALRLLFEVIGDGLVVLDEFPT